MLPDIKTQAVTHTCIPMNQNITTTRGEDLSDGNDHYGQTTGSDHLLNSTAWVLIVRCGEYLLRGSPVW